jgi:hypothetical protein
MSEGLPRRAERLLETLGADTEFRDAVIGDLAEEYEIRVRWDGAKVARRWYYGEAVRVTPWLLRDWLRGLRWKHIGHFANAALWASLVMFVVDFPVRAVLSLFVPQVMSGALPLFIIAPLMLLWTVMDGALAGYVAARIGRRAPIQSAALVALIWASLMIGSGWSSVPRWFLAVNVTLMLAGTITGGLLRTLRVVRGD